MAMVTATAEVNRAARIHSVGAPRCTSPLLKHFAADPSKVALDQAQRRCWDNLVGGEPRSTRSWPSLARARPLWPSIPRAVAAAAAAAAAAPRLEGGRLGEGSGAGAAAMLGLRRQL